MKHPTTRFEYDVFLSHNQADKPRVRQLAERLRAAGRRVWFDDWVIQPGDDIYLAIERGLETSRTLVLCLSPAAVSSDWVGLERSTVLFRDPANAGRRFVPLLLADCALPDTLRRYKCVDFREEGKAPFEELLRACPGSSRRRQAKSAVAAPNPLAPANPGPALPAADFLQGHWMVTARAEGRDPYEVFLSLKVFDKILLGTVSYPSGNGTIVEGKIDGDTFTFQTRHVPNFENEEMRVAWYGKRVGEALAGFAGQAEFTAKRLAEPRQYGWTGRGLRLRSPAT